MKNRNKILLLALMAAASIGTAAAQTTPTTFEYTTFSDILVAGAVVVATVAGSLGAIKAGVMVWGKIAKYFSKAG